MMGLCSKQARSLREGGYYHVYQVSDARTIRRVTKQKVEEIQIGLDRLLRRFEDDLNEMIAPKSLKVLVVEDEPDIALSYKMVLENNGHRVIVANTGEDCLKMYRLALLNVSPGDTETQPFDSLILDYRLPGIDGMQVAKEILSLNPDQRIIFASAYVKETLVDSIRNLKQVVELIQKPFEPDVLVETVEDREVHAKLGKLIVDMGGAELDAEGEQIRNLFESLRKLQKGRTF
jgi:CheY-like chemotaxis protein